jgi:outer membrane protein assembly factor BamB
MWRHDPQRTGATSLELPRELTLQWVRELPAPKTAWPDQPRLQFDAAYEPVVAGQTLLVSSGITDSLTAYDTRTGLEKWRFFAEGPIRFAPVLQDGRVYFGADDGALYCLSADQGRVLWKFSGAPRDRRVLGNGRLISTWPARGSPVIADGIVYFGASIWPFMGTFLYALDAASGKTVWVNDADGSTYMTQPHKAESFAGVAPQGALAVAGDRLLVPGGRSVPAVYDRKTGKFLYYKLGDNSRRGGHELAVAEGVFFNAGAGYEVSEGKFMGDLGRQPVVSGSMLYFGGKTRGLQWTPLPRTELVETVDRKGQKQKQTRWVVPRPDTLDMDRVEALLKAGSGIYAGSRNQIVRIQIEANRGEIDWKAPIEGTPLSLVAADDRLFAATREGRIYCFGRATGTPRVHRWTPRILEEDRPNPERAERLIRLAQARGGYALVWGAGDGQLLSDLAHQRQVPELHVIGIDRDPEKIRALREQFVGEGIYGDRVELYEGDPRTFPFPPYLASLVVVDGWELLGAREDLVRRIYSTLRPYGGTACVEGGLTRKEVLAAKLEGLELGEEGETLVLRRSGALAGSANWTHEHADASNTRVSKDRLVRAPLGLLWFGGTSHEGILPRHGHGPQPQVVDGRMIIEGINMLRAIDVYTGRLLWEAPLPAVGQFYNNLFHQPGANASGTNFISLPDGIYVSYGRECVRLDPATGARTGAFTLPADPGQKESSVWGYLGVCDDVLVGGADPFLGKLPPPPSTDPRAGDDDPLLPKVLPPRGDPDNLSSSRKLVALDRHTGRLLWSVTSSSGFRHNAIAMGGGRLYAVDRLSGPQIDRLKRRGEKPSQKPRLVAFDLATGKELWSTEWDVFGTWLSYSEPHDILVEAGRFARDTILDEPRGMRAYRAATGGVLWSKDYVGPAMIHGDTVLAADKACDLRTGELRARAHPVTGETVAWTWTRNYGCNTPAASEHLLTFRSGAAGYFDLATDGGTGNFGGFRSSCTHNLVVAGGVLCAPDYTRTCTCSYQNQTSLALVPMPEAEEWTFYGSTEVKGPVRHVGINLGAPGDRRAPDGTYWMEYPSVGGKSPNIPISLSGEVTWYRRHTSRFTGPMSWVGASGAIGIRELVVTLDGQAREDRAYTVRLHFAEPDDVEPGERVFGVSLQGKEVLRDFDVVREAGGPRRTLIKEFSPVLAKKELKIALKSGRGAPVLSGIQIVARCNIPVFRYALERWPSDSYEVAVFHRGPLGAAEGTLYDELRSRSDRANFVVSHVDVARPREDLEQSLWRPPPEASLPRVAIFYPEIGRRDPAVWSAPLDQPAVERLVDSPARRDLVRRILSGDSAVWILLESGDPEKDDPATAHLEAKLRKLEKELKLPGLTEAPADRLLNLDLPLKVAFSVRRVSRSDSAEAPLVRMLLASEADLEQLKEPMAFPVFGRGRVLRALVGAGITDENVEAYGTFLCGACSCEAKLLSPGLDLLVAADWGEVFKGPPVPEPEIAPRLPPGTPAGEDRAPAPVSPLRPVLWVGIGAAAFLVLATGIRVLRRGAP